MNSVTKTIFFGAIFCMCVVTHLRFFADAARCDGLPGGTMLIHESFTECNRYVVCQHETDHEWFCPPGEFFNPRNLQCEPACPPGREQLWCAGVADGFFIRVPLTMPANCQQYYTCFGGNMFLQTCPQGFFFSQPLQACTLDQADC